MAERQNPWGNRQGGEWRDKSEREGRRVKEEFQAESIQFRFPPPPPPSHTAARVQTDAVISILMRF